MSSDEVPLENESIADIQEADLVDRLLGDDHWRSRLLGIRGIPSTSQPIPRVPLTGLPKEVKGDVDILLVPPDCPREAIAIEVKRIKVGLQAIRSGRPNKMQEFEKGVRQANLLAGVGFSQVYLWVLVVVDTREQNAGRYAYDGLCPNLSSKISQLIRPMGLHPRIGLIHYKFVQSMDDVPLGLGTYVGQLVRPAQRIDQPAEVTAWVARLKGAA